MSIFNTEKNERGCMVHDQFCIEVIGFLKQ